MNTRTRTEWENIFTAPAGVAGFLSNAAEWLGLRDLVISIVLIFQDILVYMTSATQAYIDTKQPGSVYWLPGMAKAFQYGDSLTVINKAPAYATIDATKQIIAVAGVKVQADGQLDFKAAKLSGGTLVPLSSLERSAWADYLERMLGPGVVFSALSSNADVVKTTISYLYDPLYSSATMDAAIDAVLDAFKLEYHAPNGYDTILYYSQLYENIMGVPGMKSLTLQIDLALSNGLTITNMNTYQELPAGYFNYDAASSKTGTPAP